ncbi:MAG: ATP-binding cassette domain-containing protein, partial [Caldilineaceae bacterium]|nr:ATP-binding cassette domain-containing protein [Caldilineaceae bacterium]
MKPVKIACQHVWKVFGAAPAHIADTVTPEMTRSEVLERTGHVLAVRDVSFEVYDGEIFVVMGLSGSGKSTLAFDTIYAEGQRRYVESLSAYARQFLGLMSKPDVDSIEGLS